MRPGRAPAVHDVLGKKGPIMANQQAAVTVTGFVAGDPVKGGNDNFVVLTFRMGSTRSRFNAATRQWRITAPRG